MAINHKMMKIRLFHFKKRAKALLGGNMLNMLPYYPSVGMINDLRLLSPPPEHLVEARREAVELIKIKLDSKYCLHPKNFVKHIKMR
jgi:hypothetical protein